MCPDWFPLGDRMPIERRFDGPESLLLSLISWVDSVIGCSC